MTAEQRRSEVVRARRGLRKNTASVSRASRKNTGRPIPPMVSRTGMVSVAHEQENRRRKAQATGRRRVDLPIRAGNAEIRLPVVTLPRMGGRGFSLVVVLLLSFALFWMINSPAYSATGDRIQVDGLERVDRELILAKSGILNKPVFLISPESLVESLPKAVPALDSAKVSVKMNGAVVIKAMERVPVLIWDQDGLPQPSWVDLEGRLFPAYGTSENLVHVKANGYPPIPRQLLIASSADEEPEEINPEDLDKDKGREQLLDPELVSNILTLARSLPPESQLVYDQDHGFGWEDPNYHWMVFFGKQLDQSTLRVKIYEEIAAMFTEKQHKPVLISVEYIHAPYYRMEP
ncbi:MAG: hypothetical protein JW757_11590 [Anaerolineales bacterium]|nr:hypothetical protein [Anaerolineales bacterium]